MKNWGKITKQPKSKKWISAEYSNTNIKPHLTILIYKEDAEYKEIYGNYRIFVGRTDGKERGTYQSADTYKQAL